MSIHELKIYLDLSPESKSKVLDKYASKIDLGYFFFDSKNGHCYLFDEDGEENDVSLVHEITDNMIPINIKKIVIPDGITSIDHHAFFYCDELTNIMIPNGVTSIGDSAFFCCSGLTGVTMPDSVTSIGYEVFDGCNNLKSIIFKGKTIDQIRAMENYPFGIEDESIIKTELS